MTIEKGRDKRTNLYFQKNKNILENSLYYIYYNIIKNEED